jgi:hypothetical protein
MNDLHVSLESHLILTLRPLLDIIPAPLSEKLSQRIDTANPTISYALLQSISRWVRTEEGKSALSSKVPPLDPLHYNMVSLLAGARTSPDKKFPSSPTRSDGIAREIGDRRLIIAVLNSLLSVICTGAATWWATQRTSWRDEWVCSHLGCDDNQFLIPIGSRKFSCRFSRQRLLRPLKLHSTSYGILDGTQPRSRNTANSLLLVVPLPTTFPATVAGVARLWWTITRRRRVRRLIPTSPVAERHYVSA